MWIPWNFSSLQILISFNVSHYFTHPYAPMLWWGSFASHPRFITLFLLDAILSCLPLFWLPPSCNFTSGSKKPSSLRLQISSDFCLRGNFPCSFCFLKLLYFCFHSQSHFWNKSPTCSSGNLNVALQDFPQTTHLKLKPDVLIVELNYLSHFSPILWWTHHCWSLVLFEMFSSLGFPNTRLSSSVWAYLLSMGFCCFFFFQRITSSLLSSLSSSSQSSSAGSSHFAIHLFVEKTPNCCDA